jgi:hypothetical protein
VQPLESFDGFGRNFLEALAEQLFVVPVHNLDKHRQAHNGAGEYSLEWKEEVCSVYLEAAVLHGCRVNGDQS